MALKLIDGPTDLAVSLERVKQHLRVTSTDQDDLIELYIKAATRQIDGPTYRGICLKPQTWDFILDTWPHTGVIDIPLSPLIEVISVGYVDGNSPEPVVAAANYQVDLASTQGRVVPVGSFTWPTLDDAINAVRVRFRAGYEDTDDSPPESTVPENSQLALMLMVGDAFAFRESVVAGGGAVQVPMSVTVENLLHTDRIFR